MSTKKLTFKLGRKTVAALTAGFLIIGGGAYAYWTTTSQGTGAAPNAASNGSIVLTASFAPGLTPGASAAVSYTADNPGTSSLQVGTISHVVSTSNPLCLPADFTITNVPSNTTVPAGSDDFPIAGAGTLSFADTSVNQDACKSAIVTLTLTAN
ncbi:hypothetical protein [Arthrobacter sp. CDRTa11]|uniref:hypothetical protein n=1 Tax=Arthrobacter sp. CDRTa11 TaxID=2651199 RepID=UPI002265CF43|nr:hypothetical protein [Arthrobacter sp. CDRTa11]